MLGIALQILQSIFALLRRLLVAIGLPLLIGLRFRALLAFFLVLRVGGLAALVWGGHLCFVDGAVEGVLVGSWVEGEWMEGGGW